ncbi:MAG: Ig-like domain-containing protein, partial [SAR324 cluster bacterium]|nr:Ig-like domain-containing protein [SAR324 cluster bacterium]
MIQKEPRDNATGVARNVIPTLTFNGPLFEGTSLQFELRYSGNQSLVSCSPSLWAASVHCLPNFLLDNSTSYTATLLKDSLQSLENVGLENIF